MTVSFNRCLPLAEAYRCLPGKVGHRVHEKAEMRPSVFPYTERHLSCVWVDPALRPPVLYTHMGEEVVVEHPGSWNLEAGPDFLNAVLRLGPEKRRVRGDVEIHIHPAAWQQHGHGRDPAYRRVIAHVTFFAVCLPDSVFPGDMVQIALQSALQQNPLFSFEAIDLTAYPYAFRAPRTPCSILLSEWDPDRIAALLESAGEERLRRKALRLANAVQEQNPEQVLYKEVLCALGYKKNSNAFKHLADQVPLEALKEDSRFNPVAAYALLAGVAGLLPNRMHARWDEETRAFIRQVWNHWWKYQSKYHARLLSRKDWVLHGLRPHNHPLRRLMFAAILFSHKESLNRRLPKYHSGKPAEWLKKTMQLLGTRSSVYWCFRLALGGKKQRKAVPLVGSGRLAAIISNVLVPFMIAEGKPEANYSELLRQVPAEEDNNIIRKTAHVLLGPDHNPRLYRTGLRQQGMLQIFHDFCLNDRSNCQACPLTKNLAGFNTCR